MDIYIWFFQIAQKNQTKKKLTYAFCFEASYTLPLNSHHLIFFQNLTGDPGVCIKHYFNPSYLLFYA